jgi:hypothetical protein
VGTGDSFPGLKYPECEVDLSPKSNAEAKNGGAIPPLPQMSSWHNSSLIEHRGNFKGQFGSEDVRMV